MQSKVSLVHADILCEQVSAASREGLGVTEKLTGDRLVGSRLRLLRRQRSIEERELAEILGVEEAKVALFESGALRLGAERLGRVARALDVPLGYFFAPLKPLESTRTTAATSRKLLAEPGASELVTAYSSIASSQLRAAVLKLVQRLARESHGRGSPPARAQSPAHRSNSQAR
jgi:transcriptional regulator with XRE-family HTH domain